MPRNMTIDVRYWGQRYEQWSIGAVRPFAGSGPLAPGGNADGAGQRQPGYGGPAGPASGQ